MRVAWLRSHAPWILGWLAAAAALGGCGDGHHPGAMPSPEQPDGAVGNEVGDVAPVERPDKNPDLAPDMAGDRMMPPPPEGRRLVDGPAILLGSGADSCTRGAGDTWCAFARPSASIGKTELWVINVTAAGAAPSLPVSCTGAGDAICRKLTDNLWTEAMPASGAGYPYAHSFQGDTLVFEADATSGAGEHFKGAIRAWRPGWSATQSLTTTAGWVCAAGPKGGHAFCLDKVDQSSGDHAEFDYTAGPLAAGGAPLPVQTHVFCCDEMNVRKYSAQFSPGETVFAYSTRSKATDKETFYYRKVEDLAAPSDANRVKLFDSGESRLGFLGDARIYYLKAFNHDPMTPSGELVTQAFPPGGSVPTSIATGVASAGPLDPSGADRGLLFYSDIAMGKAKLWILRDVTMPGGKQKVSDGACAVAGFSRDLGRVVVSEDCSASGVNLLSFDLDPSTGAPKGAPCTLTATSKATTFGLPSISDDGRWAYWVDDVDTSTGVGAGRLTDNTTCTTKDTGKDVWAWDPVRSVGFVDNVESDGKIADLRLVDLTSGVPAFRTVAAGADVTYALLAPAEAAVVFTISAGFAATDGLWLFDAFPAAWAPVGGADGGADGP